MKAPSRWGRRFLRRPRLRQLLCWLIHVYIRLVYATNRWTVEGAEHPRRLRAQGRSFILAFWHGRLLMIPMAWQRLAPMHMLISAHRDGRIIADAVTYFGVESIPGSTQRGGSTALRTMLKRLDAGDCVGITPDGPRGPAGQASSGIVNVARLAGAPIVPVVYACSRRRVLRTWDRFHLALPFGRGVFLWGEPIEAPRQLDGNGIEEARRLVERRMNELADRADALVGVASSALNRPAGGTVTGWPRFYRALTAAAGPIVRHYLTVRCRRGKEDPARLNERFGDAALPRPAGPLVWVHAASVGEARSVLALVERLTAQRPGVSVLMTTGTVASARLLADNLPARTCHQYVPVDLPYAVEAFLTHWQPELAIWVESELWPNLLLATHRRGVPMLLVNGRLSARSAARWARLPGVAETLLRAFALCLAQDDLQAERFRALGARAVASVGDLKAAAPALAADPAAVAELKGELNGRPVWLAASTHPGEEEIVEAAHALIARAHPRLLTIIAPRHPVRGPVIAERLQSRGLRVARRGAGDPLKPDTEIYLADTLGELGLFYRAAGIAFVGGSLVGKGGHNLFEAARLDCVVIHGPDITNCAAMAASLDSVGAALTVVDAAGLAEAVSRLLANCAERDRLAAAACRIAEAGNGAIDAVSEQMAPWLDVLAPKASTGPDVALPMLRRAGGDARA